MSSNTTEDNDSDLGSGLTGLTNLGNTCFMNTALQCLVHSNTLKDFLNSKKYETRLNKKIESLILLEFDKLRELMWSEDCIISPGGFLSSVQKVAKIKDRTIFTGFAQNDLTEFLVFIIDCFHMSIAREVDMEITGNVKTDDDKLAKSCYGMLKTMYGKEYSEFLDMFYGVHVSEISSLDKKSLALRPEPFLLLDIELADKNSDGEITLEDCIKSYTKSELLNDDNSYETDDGNKIEAYKKLSFWKLPDILVIAIKRFSNGIRKDESLVKFPIDDLDMSSHIIGYNKNNYNYELFGICNHIGGIMGGHYYAYIKNENNKWYNFNDSDISEINDISTLTTPSAYCFFYRKKK
jgi:ubiquitin carboxyl-terminal hydrolase 8